MGDGTGFTLDEGGFGVSKGGGLNAMVVSEIRVKTDGVRKGGAGGTVTRLCQLQSSTSLLFISEEQQGDKIYSAAVTRIILRIIVWTWCMSW